MPETIEVIETTPLNFLMAPIASVKESAYNARKLYNENQLRELASSIRANGIVQPLVTRPVLGTAAMPGWDPELTGEVCYYEVVAGSRRRRAAELAGLTEVPIIIREMSDEEAREVSLIENIQREDVHPMHEALGMRDALAVGGYDMPRLSIRLGKHERHIAKRLQLCRLIETWQQGFINGYITLGGATSVSKLEPGQQEEAAARYLKEDNEYILTQQEIDRWISHSILVVLKTAPFDLKDSALLPAAGSCVDCTKRSQASPMLWADEDGEVDKVDQCLDSTCFKAKIEAMLNAKRAKIEAKHGKGSYVEISTHYRSHAGQTTSTILGSNEYTDSKKGSCEFTKQAIVVEGELGKTPYVCTNKRCPTHGSPVSSSNPDRERQKQSELETAIRMRLLQLVIKKCPEGGLSRKLREYIAVTFANRLTHDIDVHLGKVLAIETGKGCGPHYPDLVKKMSDHELEVFMLTVALAPESKVFTWGGLERNGPLYEIAGEFGVLIDDTVNYCTEHAKARQLRGKERQRAMEQLPIDPVLSSASQGSIPAVVEPKKKVKAVKKTGGEETCMRRSPDKLTYVKHGTTRIVKTSTKKLRKSRAKRLTELIMIKHYPCPDGCPF